MATPLRSIRLSDEVWDRLEAYAAENGLGGRADAIAHALDLRLGRPILTAHTPDNLPKQAPSRPARPAGAAPKPAAKGKRAVAPPDVDMPTWMRRKFNDHSYK